MRRTLNHGVAVGARSRAQAADAVLKPRLAGDAALRDTEQVHPVATAMAGGGALPTAPP